MLIWWSFLEKKILDFHIQYFVTDLTGQKSPSQVFKVEWNTEVSVWIWHIFTPFIKWRLSTNKIILYFKFYFTVLACSIYRRKLPMCIYDVTSDGVCHTNLKKKKGTRPMGHNTRLRNYGSWPNNFSLSIWDYFYVKLWSHIVASPHLQRSWYKQSWILLTWGCLHINMTNHIFVVFKKEIFKFFPYILCEILILYHKAPSYPQGS